jgi:hypothetical protein
MELSPADLSRKATYKNGFVLTRINTLRRKKSGPGRRECGFHRLDANSVKDVSNPMAPEEEWRSVE